MNFEVAGAQKYKSPPLVGLKKAPEHAKALPGAVWCAPVEMLLV